VRKKLLLVVLAIALNLTFIATASAANYSYTLTANYANGSNVPAGATMVLTASTDNPNVCSIQFYWLNPSNEPVAPFPDTIKKPDDASTFTATSMKSVDEQGQWNAYAIFLDRFGNECFRIALPVQCKEMALHVVPEVPLLGTAGVSIAMILGLVYTKKRKAKNPTA
jgi:hypothetical protein